MATFTFPSSIELTQIAQEKLPVLTQDDPIFEEFPIVNKNVVNIAFEQRDIYIGLQQLRGVGGAPNRVKRVGAKRYIYEPGVYGEFIDVEEKELLERRPWGTFNGFVDVSDIVMELQDQLLNRRVDRIRWILWTLLTTGQFFVPLPTGGIGHADQYAVATAIGQFGMQTAAAAVTWSTFATATPLQDLRNVQLLSRGRSVDFGTNAKAFMNRSTFNNMIRNQNANDLGGKKTAGNFGTLTSPSDVNRILLDAGLPQIVIYDRTYIDDTGTVQLFIPTGTVMIVGDRTNGDPLGEYIMTRNVVNDDFGPGAYQKVIDLGAGPTPQIPRSIQVHDGHNGGPVIYYPTAVVRMTGA